MSIIPRPMPLRGEPGAPIFDDSTKEQIRELPRYFDDLELLFHARPALTDLDKKKYTVYYLSCRLYYVWTAFPEFSDPSKTFADFKNAVLRLYPDATIHYTFTDLDILIGSRQRLGITTVDDLAEYTRQFRTISASLLRSNLASEIDMRRTYIRGFQPSFYSQVFVQLQIKHPTIKPHAISSVEDVYDAAAWILTSHAHSLALRGPAHSPLTAPAFFPTASSSQSLISSLPAPSLAPASTQTSAALKPEDVVEIFEKFSESFAGSLAGKISNFVEQQNRPRTSTQSSPSSSFASTSPSITPNPTLTFSAVNAAPVRPTPPTLHTTPPPARALFTQHSDAPSPSERRRQLDRRLKELEDELHTLQNTARKSQPPAESNIRRSQETTPHYDALTPTATNYELQKSMRPVVSTTGQSVHASITPAPIVSSRAHTSASLHNAAAPSFRAHDIVSKASFYYAANSPHISPCPHLVKFVPEQPISPALPIVSHSLVSSTQEPASAIDMSSGAVGSPQTPLMPRKARSIVPNFDRHPRTLSRSPQSTKSIDLARAHSYDAASHSDRSTDIPRSPSNCAQLCTSFTESQRTREDTALVQPRSEFVDAESSSHATAAPFVVDYREISSTPDPAAEISLPYSIDSAIASSHKSQNIPLTFLEPTAKINELEPIEDVVTSPPPYSAISASSQVSPLIFGLKNEPSMLIFDSMTSTAISDLAPVHQELVSPPAASPCSSPALVTSLDPPVSISTYILSRTSTLARITCLLVVLASLGLVTLLGARFQSLTSLCSSRIVFTSFCAYISALGPPPSFFSSITSLSAQFRSPASLPSSTIDLVALRAHFSSSSSFTSFRVALNSFSIPYSLFASLTSFPGVLASLSAGFHSLSSLASSFIISTLLFTHLLSSTSSGSLIAAATLFSTLKRFTPSLPLFLIVFASFKAQNSSPTSPTSFLTSLTSFSAYFRSLTSFNSLPIVSTSSATHPSPRASFSSSFITVTSLGSQNLSVSPPHSFFTVVTTFCTYIFSSALSSSSLPRFARFCARNSSSTSLTSPFLAYDQISTQNLSSPSLTSPFSLVSSPVVQISSPASPPLSLIAVFSSNLQKMSPASSSSFLLVAILFYAHIPSLDSPTSQCTIFTSPATSSFVYITPSTLFRIPAPNISLNDISDTSKSKTHVDTGQEFAAALRKHCTELEVALAIAHDETGAACLEFVPAQID